ncbi:MAG: recombinase zinc beta ribbon domain-containing protein, partial [Chlorobia bacterium]|nr:recombinase zinc beta ribbon domain-containing protein [Fimbriimonadaceae bacterium]
MVELRCSGLGYVKIARAMNEEGLRTARGCYWTHGTTYKYLQPTWIRTMLGHGMFNRGKADPIEISNAFPPILNTEEAERLLALQRLYSEDYGRKPVGGLDWMVSKRRKRGRYSASASHLLSSLVFCPGCGGRMVAFQRDSASNRSTLFAYRCPHATTRPELHQRGMFSVNALSLDDAVLRVLRMVLVSPPDALPVKTLKSSEENLNSLQIKIDRLLALHLDAKIEDSDFQRIYSGLVLEKERLLEDKVEERSELHKRALELSVKATLTPEELRQLVLLVVDRIEAPMTLPGVTVREGLLTLRRLARITLKFPVAEGANEYLSAIYLDEFKRERKAIATNGENTGNPKSLVAPKIR